jgi:hypothetical protein
MKNAPAHCPAVVFARARADLDAAIRAARLLPSAAHEAAARAAFRAFLAETRRFH